MRAYLALCLAAALLGCVPVAEQAPPPALGQPAQAQPSGPVFVVTYFEVAPAAVRATTGLLRQFAAGTRSEPGNIEFLALREPARPGRFALVEGWAAKAAYAAHGAAMAALSNALQPVFASPFDARQFWPLDVAGPLHGRPTAATYVLTHVDVFPAGKDQVAAMVKQLTEDSRRDGGAARFDAVVWDGHPNHFHLIEAWSGLAARQTHALAAHTREFRTKLVPFEGALYDERLYEALR